MKKKWLILFILGIILIVSGILVMLIDSLSLTTNNNQNEVEKIVVDPNKQTYFVCSEKEKKLERKINSINISYQYTLKYKFSVFQNKIMGGSLIEECVFKSLDDYQKYIQIPVNSDNPTFEINEDMDNLTISYQMYSVLYSDPSLEYPDDYLDKLKKDGFTCKIIAEL